MTIQSINAEILAGNFSNDQLSSIGDAIKFDRARITEKSIRTLRLGTSVRFTSNKNGMTYSGTVDKIAIKYVTVRTQQGLWKVPASMLEAV
jgi:hypothetical protein